MYSCFYNQIVANRQHNWAFIYCSPLLVTDLHGFFHLAWGLQLLYRPTVAIVLSSRQSRHDF